MGLVIGAAALAGCGSSGSSSGGSSANASGSDVTVGLVANDTSSTPGYAQPGISEAIGAYFDNVNAQGGIDGHKFNYIHLNDQGSPTVAVTNLKTLLSDHADVIIMADDLDFYSSYRTVLGKGIPIIGCYFAAPCYQNADMYPIAADLVQSYASGFASYAQSVGAKSWGAIWVDVPAAQQSVNEIASDTQRAGVSEAYSLPYDPTLTDFTALVSRAKSAGTPYISFQAAATTDTAAFLSGAVNQGFDVKIFTSGAGAASTTAIAGSAGNGHLFGTSITDSLSDPAATAQAYALVKKYDPSETAQDFFSAEPIWTAAQAISSAVTTLTKAGKPVTSANISSTFNGFKNFTSTFEPPLTYTSGANGNPTHCIQIQEDVNGNWSLINGKKLNCWTYSTAPSGS